MFYSNFQFLGQTRNYSRPFSSVRCEISSVHNSNIENSPQKSNIIPLKLMMRHFQTSSMFRDIETAAKYIGAGAATIGVAGSGIILIVSILTTF